MREEAHGRTSSWEVTAQPAWDRLGIPHAAQTIRIILGRAEHGTGEKTGEQVFAITSLPPQVAGAKECGGTGPRALGHREPPALGPRYRLQEDKSQVRTGHGAHIMASLRNLASKTRRLAGHANITATLRALDHQPETIHRLTGI